MAGTRRTGSEDSATRALLLDAAERLLVAEGYAAVTSRRVSAEAGVKPPLVHSYFRTRDDLFVALYRRGADAGIARARQALEEQHPLAAVWQVAADPRGAVFAVEFVALAHHRKAIRAEIAKDAEQVRELQLAAVRAELQRIGVPEDALPASAVLLLMIGLGQVLRLEQGLGVTAGHAEAVAFVERTLRELTGGRLPGIGAQVSVTRPSP